MYYTIMGFCYQDFVVISRKHFSFSLLAYKIDKDPKDIRLNPVIAVIVVLKLICFKRCFFLAR